MVDFLNRKHIELTTLSNEWEEKLNDETEAKDKELEKLTSQRERDAGECSIVVAVLLSTSQSNYFFICHQYLTYNVCMFFCFFLSFQPSFSYGILFFIFFLLSLLFFCFWFAEILSNLQERWDQLEAEKAAKEAEERRLIELERLKREEEARKHSSAIKIGRAMRVYLKKKAESGGKKKKKDKKKKKKKK